MALASQMTEPSHLAQPALIKQLAFFAQSAEMTQLSCLDPTGTNDTAVSF